MIEIYVLRAMSVAIIAVVVWMFCRAVEGKKERDTMLRIESERAEIREKARWDAIAEAWSGEGVL